MRLLLIHAHPLNKLGGAELSLREHLGAIVEVYSADSFEVEFVTASGHTQALLTLGASDIRPLRDTDLMSVRSVESATG